MADVTPNPILDPILAKHGLTLRDIAHGSPKVEPNRTARLEILLAMTEAQRPAEEIAKILNTRPTHVRAKLRKIEREKGIPSAFPKADSSKKMKPRRLRNFEGPMMVDAPGDRKDCTLEATCVSNLVRYKPAARQGSCPVDCAHHSPPTREDVLEDALRRGPGFQV